MRFQPQDTVAWFQSRGVKLKTEADGRMFPVTDNSETIVNCLINAAIQAGVKLQAKAAVKSVKKIADKFHIELKSGDTLISDRVLIATGSNPLGYRWAQALGHTIIAPVPSLFTFNIKDPRLQDLAGISVENVRIALVKAGKISLEQAGALLITHWGLSGPAILRLSAWGARILHEHHYQMPLLVNWLPDYNQENLRQEMLKLKVGSPRKKIVNYSPFPIAKRLWQNLALAAGIGDYTPWAELSNKKLARLLQELTKGQYQIQGKGTFKEEFVTCGGVNLKEVDFKTMSSKICPGLYFAGEILDIDGVTGGFNFQSAWTTAWLAGQTTGS
jgi:predicted Rossmann fold flavoprotein